MGSWRAGRDNLRDLREAQVDGCSLHERTVVATIVTGSPPRLADRRLAGFLLLLLELINDLAKDNG